MNREFDLSDFLKLTQADGIAIFDFKGKLLEAKNIEKAENFSGMSSVITKMAKEFSKEIAIGDLTQLILKANQGIFVINHFNKDFMVGIYSSDITKTGLIIMSMDNLIKKISK